ncbi:CHAD domain-containing protein [Verminephrobacter aporrectodeae subsp. tuberculatae]|uniref:CYTH and CHAD domain-containing protein n=1 Tax=Verminephrobacter aporrectodeae TaxID=1110389 RepID=UPI002244312A|nr:CYTH and CHAD domain-containing protein [Verminephrobacter aporrectodeae]MCW8164360.1 CHAD domain-containing protein [Verminephrobacter aporrectodeae subsp. tuberculatae]MCW8169827.1 CHAD domain-containing protein [Verminephrobacter aporrectodeae subsp. tuberculatae]
MAQPAFAERAGEVEIKLALPARWAADPAALVARIAAVPALARRKATQQAVHSVYYDTPTQALRQQRATLRLRRVGADRGAQWLQTLKTAGRCDSALSQRGEWELPVAGPALELGQFADTPWPALDPEGVLAAALEPCFATDFERTRWTLRVPGGGRVEVALDIGRIVAQECQAPIAELELELLEGPPAALFALARRIARSTPLLPLAASKAERGFALRRQAGSGPEAMSARPVALPSGLSLRAIARQVLGEAFLQFSTNLHALQQARAPDAPELLHQARVGWRRFRSLHRLLRPGLPALPPWAPLGPLLAALGALRDLDVARLDTLPPLAQDFVADAAQRRRAWQDLQAALEQAAQQALEAVHQALQAPAVGQVLLAWVEWLETLDGPLVDAAAAPPLPEPKPARRWLRRRTRDLAKRLDGALAEAAHGGMDAQHRARILAKRLRYASEAFAALLPGRERRRHAQALAWQNRLGATRDTVQAALLAGQHGAAPELVAFLRGVAAGRKHR